MFHKKSALTPMLFSVFALPIVKCTSFTSSTMGVIIGGDEVNDRNIIGEDELKGTRQCLSETAKFKVEVNHFTTHEFIEMICDKNRIRKIEVDYIKSHKQDGDMAEYMKNCLKPKKPGAFEHFYELGKRVKKARAFMDEELMQEVPISTFTEMPDTESQQTSSEQKEDSQAEEDPDPKILEESQVHNPQSAMVDNSLTIREGEENEEDSNSGSEEDDAFDMSYGAKESDYSMFANGLCYSRLINNPKVVPAELDCAVLCIEELLTEIENILEEYTPENKTQDTNIVQPEADFFQMVGRLIRVKDTEKLIKLSRKWLIRYRMSYLHTLVRYHKRGIKEKINILNSKLNDAMKSYKSCPRESCDTSEMNIGSSETNDTPLYEWIETEVLKKHLDDDLLTALVEDDLENQWNDDDGLTKMIEDQIIHISDHNDNQFSNLKKRKTRSETVSSEELDK